MLKDIMSLVKEGRPDEAALAAECGRALSPLERIIYFHYVTLSVLGGYMNHDDAILPDPYPKWIKLKKEEEAQLCSIFLEAIQRRDGHKVWEIAQAVWFLKNVFESKTPADSERAHLLSIKQYLDNTGEKWPMQMVVYSLEQFTGKKIKDQGDGFSALRKKCKALGVPIAKSRRGRRKKAA